MLDETQALTVCPYSIAVFRYQLSLLAFRLWVRLVPACLGMILLSFQARR